MAFPAAEVPVIYGCSETESIATRRAEPTPPLPPTAGYCVGAVHPDLEIELADPQPFWLPTSGAQTSVGEIRVRGRGRHTGCTTYTLSSQPRPAGFVGLLTFPIPVEHGFFSLRSKLWPRRGTACRRPRQNRQSAKSRGRW